MKVHRFAGFRFADEESAQNARLAVNPDRPAAFVIDGPPGSGKSSFIKEVHSRVFPNRAPACHLLPCSTREWIRVLSTSVDVGFLWLDGVKELGRVPDFACFLTSTCWTWRRPGTSRFVTCAQNTLVFIEGVEIALSADFERRVRRITLAPRKEAR